VFKVLIIEDDIIWQIKLQVMLEEFGFLILLATSLAEAKQLLTTESPKVILADVRLPDGSALEYFNVHPVDVPIVFVTEFADRQYVDQALTIPFASFYVKPFHPLTLVAAIQMAYTSFTNTKQEDHPVRVLKVPIRYGKKADIPFGKICWIEVEGNYSTIQTTERKYVQKLSFNKLLPELDERFIQIHKSVIVNRDFIGRVNLTNDTIQIRERNFQIGRSFRKGLIDRFDQHTHSRI
jgi:two-component system, LytTR family, response regulator LytT